MTGKRDDVICISIKKFCRRNWNWPSQQSFDLEFGKQENVNCTKMDQCKWLSNSYEYVP